MSRAYFSFTSVTGVNEGFTHKAMPVKNSGLSPHLEFFTNRVSGRLLLQFAHPCGAAVIPIEQKTLAFPAWLTWGAKPATPLADGGR